MKPKGGNMYKWIISAIITIAFASGALAQSSNYKIRTGDQLSIEVLEDPSLNRALLVLPDGNISFPLAGTLKAAGLTVAQLKSALTSKLAPNFAATPSVFIAVQAVSRNTSSGSSRRQIEVFLIGEVVKPGMHEVNRGTTVLQFLAQSGGFTKFASKKRIQLRRTDASTGQVKVYSIDYRAVERGGDIGNAMAPLVNGDVIVVPEKRLFE
jgi:polysaccharide export outer membrane protein